MVVSGGCIIRLNETSIQNPFWEPNDEKTDDKMPFEFFNYLIKDYNLTEIFIHFYNFNTYS